MTCKCGSCAFNLGKPLCQYDSWIPTECLHTFTDAAGSAGYGVVFGSHWYFGEWPASWTIQPISFVELFPIMASIHTWAPQLCNKGNIIHTDNQALCHVINNSTSKNYDIMVRTLVITCMQFNVLNVYQ